MPSVRSKSIRRCSGTRREANVNTKENAITNEIREFAKENPEITAALLRSLMREEK